MLPASQNTTEAASDPCPSRTVTVGIIGGGQLGRLLCLNADERFKTVVLSPSPQDPAAQVCDVHIQADFDNTKAVSSLAQMCDVITYEFENVSTEALAPKIVGPVPVRPNTRALTISQDRLSEKTFLRDLGIATAPFAQVNTAQELADKARQISAGHTNVLVKTRRFGYDGKGQYLYNPNTAAASEKSGPGATSEEFVPSIIEGLVDFEAEISVIAARSIDGQITCFEPARNYHSDGILRRSVVPCGFSSQIIEEAKTIATQIVEALDYVGVIGVEFFVADGELLVNEFAPRVHNSGHWTEAACDINQFEQHMYAVAGFDLRPPKLQYSCEMFNLIGNEIEQAQELEKTPDTVVTLYAKNEVRSGRKMGHYTRLIDRI